MTARKCLKGKVATGLVDKGRGEQLDEMLQALEADHQARLGPEAAARQAALDAAAAAKAAAARKRRLTHLTVIAQDRITRQLATHPKGPAVAAKSMLHRDLTQLAPWHNVEGLKEVIRGEAHRRLSGLLARLRPGLAGLSRDLASAEDLVRALFGEPAGDDATELASAWSGTAEWLRTRFNRAGGAIPALGSWRLPQSHSPTRIADAGYAGWADFVRPRLDRAAMLDHTTGLPLSDARLEFVLQDVYRTLASEGLNKLKPGASYGGAGRGKMLAMRRQDGRVLHFKDADGWLSYNQRFGGTDIASALFGEIDRMASEIALLEIWGPNPDRGVELAKDLILKAVAETDATARSVAAHEAQFFQDMYDDVAGKTAVPVNARLAAIGSEIRAGISSALLGSAAVSAVSDAWTVAMASAMNGIPVTRVGWRMLSTLSTLGDKQLAVQLGFVADSWTRVAGSAARFSGDQLTNGFFARANDVVLRASGLTALTQAAQWSFQVEMAGLLGRHMAKPFSALPGRVQSFLGRYGLSADDWDLVRSVKPWSPRPGAVFLRTADVARLEHVNAERIAETLHRAIVSERDLAVTSADPRTRAIMQRGTRRGTVLGEATRTLFQFKSFPITFMSNHIMRAASMRTLTGRLAYAGILFGGMSLMGFVAMQAKQVIRGKDLRDPEDPDTWKAAALQGGGMGLLGDFFLSDQNRFGQNVMTTLAGPGASFATDVSRLMIGNAQELASGEATGAAGEAVRFVGRWTPGSSIWFSRVAVERGILDQLAGLADPEWEQKAIRRARKVQRETGQGYWWQPGELTPDRAPRVAAAPSR